ncbi:uncharacterized protein LOC115633830 [Scaptodrosophila lebanonensis]|uniref:Uncharacterized protein LOC115633830 n=1 Tax=Drosophila lebanonensis TaxID=7225 RepID=A0A6J2UI60_DROLE|nr:uncharacterized protein LOC115633830 [Scaptodrosophila lebanonensis]
MQFSILFTIAVAVLLQKDVLCLPLNDDSNNIVIVLENDEMEPTVLDCDYDIQDTESFLTVKWFRNDKTIYQWIRGSHPSPIPEFKNDIDTSYESSTDPNKQYSSLALINPSISTTGDYKCVVQTQKDTHIFHKRVQVIDVRNYTLTLHHNKIHNETQLECMVSNVFPKPTLTITSDDEDDEVKVVTNDPQENEDGYYNATTVAAVYDDDEDADIYKCVVTFDGYAQNLTTTTTSGSLRMIIDVRLIWIYCIVYIFSASL